MNFLPRLIFEAPLKDFFILPFFMLLCQGVLSSVYYQLQVRVRRENYCYTMPINLLAVSISFHDDRLMSEYHDSPT